MGVWLLPEPNNNLKWCPVFIDHYRALAQFERKMLLERQREGIDRAKAEGKFKGRKPTAREKQPEIQRMHSEGMKPDAIAAELGISRMSVYRYL